MSRFGFITFAVVAGLAVGLAGLWFCTVQPVAAVERVGTTAAVDPARLRQDVEFLAGNLPKRNHAHPAILNQAAAYIARRLREAGGTVQIQPYEVEGTTYRNVVARFGPPGANPVVIGAHYDADEDTPGADDNASGVAGLLALADHFGKTPPPVPVEIVAYCLEEPPYFRTEHMGSRHHARQLKESGVTPRAILVLEMIGYFSDQPGSQTFPVPGLGLLYPDKGDFIGVIGNYSSAGMVRRVKAALRAAGTVPVEATVAPAWVPGIDFSDHASYWHEGMAAVMITDTAFYRNRNYHESTDLPATLDYTRMAGVVRAVALAVERAAEQ